MKTLTAKDLLNAKLEIKELFIPELNGNVYLIEPTGLERAEYESYIGSLKDDADAIKILRAYCAVQCLSDQDGNKLFKNDQVDEVNKLMSAKVLDRILEEYQNLVLNNDKDIEEAAKK